MRSLLGVDGHFLNHTEFYPTLSMYWHIDNTLPFLKEMATPTVVEALYILTAYPDHAFVADGRTDPAVLASIQVNHGKVDGYLTKYDASGIIVTLVVFAMYPGVTTYWAENNTEFSTWVADLVSKHPCVTAVQFHNEPNLATFWRGTPEQYTDVFREYADKIRAVRPDIQLVGGAISSLWWGPGVTWLKRAVDRGLLDYVDGIAMHPYWVDFPPEIDPHWRVAPISDPNHREKALQAFWALVQSWNTTGKPLSLYFTEWGWQTGITGAGHLDELKQADYLSRAIMIFQDVRLRGVPIESVYWYDFKEDNPAPDNVSGHFGLMSYDLTVRKPAYQAYKAIAKYFRNTADFEAIDLNVIVAGAPASLKLKTWRRKSDGATIVVFWDGNYVKESSQSYKIKMTVPLPATTMKQLYASEVGSRTFTPTPVAGGAQADLVLTTRASWLEIK